MKAKKFQKEKLSITWYGHSAFLLKAPGGKSVLIDPWLDNPRAPAGAKEIAPVDLILLTHGHSDHVGNTMEIARRTKATVIAIYEISLYLQEHGVSTVQGMNKGGTIRIDGLKVTMVDARHSSDIDVGGTVIPGGEPAGFVIEFENGFRAYHAGDTSLFGDMKLIAELYKPQLAFLPIGGLYTMDPREAAYACRLLKPSHIACMHYGTFPVLAGTPTELRNNLPPALKKHVMELVPGQPVAV
ncbi:MAG TPA: metal-dependent hydrolase [Bacteroidetes bacterium]|nr:metal-dependent hydrolase [Bacteroidota bacterium]